MNPQDRRDNRRDFLKSQLKRVSALWPLQASPEALAEYERVLFGFTDDEVRAGFDHVIETHAEAAAPKPGVFRAAVGQVAKVRRNIAAPEVERVASGRPIIAVEFDMPAIEAWAREPHNADAVNEELATLTRGWDAASLQHRHVLWPQAARQAYERAHPRLKVLP